MERIFFSGRHSASGRNAAAEPAWNVIRRKNKFKIAVVGISRGAGATFTAMSLAFLLSKNAETGGTEGAAYVEMRCPTQGEAGAFFTASLDQRFRGKRFTDFFGLYREHGAGKQNHETAAFSPFSSRINLHKGINWVVRRAKSGPACTQNKPEQIDLTAFPLDEIAGNWILADSPPLETLQQYDLVVGVINPLPAQVYAGAETFEILRDSEDSGVPVLWVVNQDNMDVNHGELRRFLRLKEYETVPLAGPETFFRAQYTCRLPIELLEGGTLGAMQHLADFIRRKQKETEKAGVIR